MIKDERKAGNPVACLIHSLQLDQNKVRGEGGGGAGWNLLTPVHSLIIHSQHSHSAPPTHTHTQVTLLLGNYLDDIHTPPPPRSHMHPGDAASGQLPRRHLHSAPPPFTHTPR